MTRLKAAAPTPTPPRNIGELLSTRLHTLANLSAAITTLRVERKFGLSLLEWRALGHLGAAAPLSLKDLARRAGLEKSYASRTVSALIDKGLVSSVRSDLDARGVLLSLTAEGVERYDSAFADALHRNDSLLASVAVAEQQQLMRTLDTLTAVARRALEDERKAVESGEEPNDTPPARPAARASSDGAVDLAEVRQLVARLSEVLGGH